MSPQSPTNHGSVMVEYKTYINLCEERDKLREALGVAKGALSGIASTFQEHRYMDCDHKESVKSARQALARIEEILK